MPRTLAWIEELAGTVDRLWSNRGYRDEGFHEIAHEALRSVDPRSHFDPHEILNHILGSRRDAPILGLHTSTEKITLYYGDHFRIYAHFWIDGIASPHQHPWSGAYQVIQGESLNANYAFAGEDDPRADLQIGRLSLTSLSTLRPGDLIAIRSGTDFIHSVCHLDRPGITLSINAKRWTRPNLSYLRPGVGFDPGSKEDRTSMKVRALAVYSETDRARWTQALESLARSADLHELFLILCEAKKRAWDLPPSVLTLGKEIHGTDRFTTLIESLQDIPTYHKFMEVRKTHREDPELRFFLSSLYLAETRPQLAKLVAERFANRDADQMIAGWLVQLLFDLSPAETKTRDDLERLFEHWLEGQPQSALAKDFPEHAPAVLPLLESMKDSIVYRALFR